MDRSAATPALFRGCPLFPAAYARDMDPPWRVPDRFVTIEPNEFVGLFELAQKAAAHEIDSPNPQDYGLVLDQGGGKWSRLRLGDVPMNRAAVAIKQEYGADPVMFMSVLARLVAFAEVYQRHLDQFGDCLSRNDQGEIRGVAEPLIKAAATTPLDRRMSFDLEQFRAEVRRHTQEEESQQGASE